MRKSLWNPKLGSGKSILLQALSLILGQRADLSTIRANASKCIVEATFDMDKHKLKTIFDQLDLDEERHTLIPRYFFQKFEMRGRYSWW
jgi:DNA repair protein RecN (Recombination protein N)